MSDDERRLATRVLLKWKALAGERHLPRRTDLVPDSLGMDCPNCVLVALAEEFDDSCVLYAGDLLRRDIWSPDRPVALADFPRNSLLRLATAKIPKVIERRAPITFGGTGVRDAAAILYRAILLPLSEDGERVDHVLGAISCKDITETEEYPEAERPSPLKADPVAAYIAFSSRRVSFAPAAARKPMPATIR
ncbi:MAG: hypothetical protein ACREFD_06930 [Stellaceae bacterium]